MLAPLNTLFPAANLTHSLWGQLYFSNHASGTCSSYQICAFQKHRPLHCWKGWCLKIPLCHFAVLWRSYSFKAKALSCIRNINICQKYVCNQHSESGKHPYAERLVQHVFKFKHIFNTHERKLCFSISPCIGCCTYSLLEKSVVHPMN